MAKRIVSNRLQCVVGRLNKENGCHGGQKTAELVTKHNPKKNSDGQFSVCLKNVLFRFERGTPAQGTSVAL